MSTRSWIIGVGLALAVLCLILLRDTPSGIAEPSKERGASSGSTSIREPAPAPAVPRVEPRPENPDGPPKRARSRLLLSLYGADGSEAPPCQIIVLGDERVMMDFSPLPDAPDRNRIELDVVGGAQRLLVIPDAPDLAVAVRDVTLDGPAATPVSIVLLRGTRISGVVVDSRGDPVADKFVSTLIVLPGGPPPGAATFAHRLGSGVEYFFDESGLFVTTSTDAQGRFTLVNLPESAAKLSITWGGNRVEQIAAGRSVRLVLPDLDER